MTIQEIGVLVAIVLGIFTIVGKLSGFFSWLRAKLTKGGIAAAVPPRPRQTIALVHQAYPASYRWDLGSSGGRPALHLHGKFFVTNLLDNPVRVPVAKLRKPKQLGWVGVKEFGSSVFGQFTIPPHQTTELSFDFSLQPPPKMKGKVFPADIAFLDQFGNEHWVRNVGFEGR